MCRCVCVSDSLTHKHTDTETHRHRDTPTHRRTQIALQSITNFYLCLENPKFKEKKLYAKTLFALNFVLEMFISERVLKRQLQGLFKSGPKSFTYNLTNYAQMYLKIHHFHL